MELAARLTTLAARRTGCRFTEKRVSHITEGVRLSSSLLPLAQPHTCALHPVHEVLGLCLGVPLPPQEEPVAPEQPPAALLRVSVLVVEVMITLETAELRQMLPKDLFCSPTGLQGGLAGGGGLPPGREEEGEDPGCLLGGPGPAAGEAARALVRLGSWTWPGGGEAGAATRAGGAPGAEAAGSRMLRGDQLFPRLRRQACRGTPRQRTMTLCTGWRAPGCGWAVARDCRPGLYPSR